MALLKPNPARDENALRKRVAIYFSKARDGARPKGGVASKPQSQLPLVLGTQVRSRADQVIATPNSDINELFDLVSSTVPEGDLYLFGGMLRDLALFGIQGFTSDIDLVIDGDWDLAYPRLIALGARRNKFGGLRFFHKGVPVDIWLASSTWAIKSGLVVYQGIHSLLDTTVLNWDAILMNWRTKAFLYRTSYFDELTNGYMDIVLEQNPNSLGMLVRVMRHIVLKDAMVVSYHVFDYLRNAVERYSMEEIVQSELASYGDSYISRHMYNIFKKPSMLVEDCVQKGGICVAGTRKFADNLL